MHKALKKTVSLITTVFLIGIFSAPAVFAAIECDTDGDGYISVPTTIMSEINPDLAYNEDGNYNAIQWGNFYNIFTVAQEGGELIDEEKCLALNFKKGMEAKRCDNVITDADSGVYDPAKVNTVSGSSIFPGAFDKPNNGIDENCDGSDGELITSNGETKDLGGLVEKTISLLSRAVVIISIVIMIWGGILYATAAGDEQKTGKARKAIIGAIIGLIVGLLAPAIVNWITASLG